MTIINLLHVSVLRCPSQGVFQFRTIGYTPNALIQACIQRTGMITF